MTLHKPLMLVNQLIDLIQQTLLPYVSYLHYLLTLVLLLLLLFILPIIMTNQRLQSQLLQTNA